MTSVTFDIKMLIQICIIIPYPHTKLEVCMSTSMQNIEIFFFYKLLTSVTFDL